MAKVLQTVVDAVAPLTAALRRAMPASVAKVASLKDPGLIAILVLALRWPDLSLASEYVVGHRLVGHLPTSNLFRDVHQEEIAEDKLAQ